MLAILSQYAIRSVQAHSGDGVIDKDLLWSDSEGDTFFIPPRSPPDYGPSHL